MSSGASDDAPDPACVSRRVVVGGRVQGVGYRQACAEAARRHHLAGWVRNRRDGVEAVFEGPPGAVALMVGWCRSGPPMADVTDVSVTKQAPSGVTGFRIGATE